MQDNPNAMVERMFAAEFAFMQSDGQDLSLLAAAFDPEVVVHEPESLPYAGDWRGLDGVGRLIRVMSATWKDMSIESLECAASGSSILLACSLTLVGRATGTQIVQPFAERLVFRDGRLLDGTPFYFDTAALRSAIG